MLNRPTGQYDAFISSDEGSDMDVSDSEVDEPTITLPSRFVAVAPSDYNKPTRFTKEDSFVSSMRNFVAEQARDPSNHITPRVEHFAATNASEPIQVDSDSDAESASSFHTAPSSPREEDEDLEKEMQLIAEAIEENNKAIGHLKTEVTELSKKKSNLNLKILQNKVRNSITRKKRTVPRETPKVAAATVVTSEVRPKPVESKKVDNSRLTVDSARIIANKNKGKQKEPLPQPPQPSQPLHQKPQPLQQPQPLPQPPRSLPQPPRPLSQKSQSLSQKSQPLQEQQIQHQNTNATINIEPMTTKCIVIDPQLEAKKMVKNVDVPMAIVENNLENTKETSMKRKADAKKNEKDAKKLKNLVLKDKLRSEKNENDMEMSRKATELAKQMYLENPQDDSAMEDGELLDSNSNSSENSGSGSVGGISRSNGISGNGLNFQAAPKKHGNNNIPNMINAKTQHTANRNNFQPYRSALSSIGLSGQSRPSDSQDKPLCTFEQNGGTCNNESCQAAHFRDFF